MFYGDNWKIDYETSLQAGIDKKWFVFEQDGRKIKAIENRRLRTSSKKIVDIEEL